jgi:peptidylprolyl isomerase
MAQAQYGNTVKVHYTGKLEDGQIFDTSIQREPLQFTIGEDQVIPGFEQAIVGMAPGESKTTKLSPDTAYGPHRKEMVAVVDRNKLPEHLEPKVGEQLQVRQPDDQAMIVTIAEVTESTVTLDANHPLAGKELTFDIQLVEIV